MNAINSTQLSFSELKTFIAEQATLNPITTIFLVVLPFLGMAALGALGLRKIYQSYNNPTVDKIKSIDTLGVKPNPDTKPTPVPPNTITKTIPATPNTVESQKTAATENLQDLPHHFITVKVIQTFVLGSFLLSAYMAYNYAPSVLVSEAVKGYYTNWAQTAVPQALSNTTVDLATQCTLDYSIAQGGYSWAQKIYAPIYLLTVPRQIKNSVTNIFRNTVNLLSPIRNKPVASQPAPISL